jgi:hypothetical protein
MLSMLVEWRSASADVADGLVVSSKVVAFTLFSLLLGRAAHKRAREASGEL